MYDQNKEGMWSTNVMIKGMASDLAILEKIEFIFGEKSLFTLKGIVIISIKNKFFIYIFCMTCRSIFDNHNFNALYYYLKI